LRQRLNTRRKVGGLAHYGPAPELLPLQSDRPRPHPPC
jgi:hypothetical protein